MTRVTTKTVEKGKSKRLGMVGMAALFSMVVVVVSAIAGSPNFSSGVLIGGALMTGDIFLLRRVVSGLLGDEPSNEKEIKSKRMRLVLQYLLKIIGLFVILGFVIWKTKISAAGLLVGVTAAIVGTLYVGLRDADVGD